MKKQMHAVAAGIVAVALSLLAGVAWGKSFSLDLRNAGTSTRAVAANHSGPAMTFATDGILRSFNLDAGVADVGEVAVGDELTFTLFDDVALTLTLKVRVPSPLGGDVFLAEASGYGGVKNAVVMRTADGLTIDVQDYRNGKQYKVLSTANGVSVIEQDASKTGKCGCESDGLTGLDDVAAPRSAKVNSINGAPVSRSGDPAYVDILVAYDANAKAWAEANGGGMLTFAQLAVQKMNTVLYNNMLYTDYFRFRLVGVVDVAVTSTSTDSATLNAIVNGSGGWAPIKAKRDEVGADIVTTLIDTGSPYGTTGLGVSLKKTHYDTEHDTADAFSESPYNVCAIRSVAQSHTMTHEVGHNMGCGHATDQFTEPEHGLFTYSSGYYYPHAGKWYHTIMAYGSECPYSDDYTATQSPYFSDDWDYYDVETGSNFHPGNDQHYNQYTLYKTYKAASNWRASKGIDLESGYEDSLEWLRSRDAAFEKARSEGKKVFVVCGRDTCLNTQGTRENCNNLVVKQLLNKNYVCWYNLYDTESSQVDKYLSGFPIGDTFPFIAVIDVVNDKTLTADGNYYGVDALFNMLGSIPGVKYSLTRNPTGGTYKGSTAETLAADALTYGGTAWWDIGVATRSGWTFAGWFTDPSAGVMVYGADGKCVAGDYWDSGKHYIHAGNLTVYAHWTGKKYTLTRDPNGGTQNGKTEASVFANGLAVGSTAWNDVGVPTRSNYAFAGWFTDPSAGVMVYGADGKCVPGTAYWTTDRKYSYAGNLTVYAHWTSTSTKYTLTRDPNGGTQNGKTTPSVFADALAVGSTAWYDIGVPTRSGYAFAGWYNQASGGVLVYKADGKCATGSFWDADKKYKYAGNLTVYAHWVSASTKYSLTRNPLGGTLNGKTEATTVANALSLGSGAWYDIGVPTRSGYAFVGWFTDPSAGVMVYGADGKCVAGDYWTSDKRYIYAGNLTVYARWTSTTTKYSLTRNPNGGTQNGKTTATTVANALAVGSTAWYDIGVPTRSGYTFDGWFTMASGGVKVYGADGKCVTGDYWNSEKRYIYAGNLTVYAHWTATAGAKFALTRDPNGGTYKGSTAAITLADALTYGGTSWWDIGVPTRDGCLFDGWYLSKAGYEKVYDTKGQRVVGNYWTADKRYCHEGDLTVYANWAVIGEKFDLVVYPHDGTYKGSTDTKYMNAALTVGGTAWWDIGVPTRDGYTFDGWFSTYSGGVMVYDAKGQRVEGDYWTSDKRYRHNGVLYVHAHWTGKKYTLTRDPNGGTQNGKAEASVFANGLAMGSTAWSDIGVPTRAGSTFVGWFTVAGASGGVMVYDANGKCVVGDYWNSDKRYCHVGNLTVYARWADSSLAAALDNTSLKFTTGGDAPWLVQGDHAISGVIGDSQESWIETTVEGSGKISFKWSVSSEYGYDNLEFLVDGVQFDAISGGIMDEGDWYFATVGVEGLGMHTLRWRYKKDISTSDFYDAGYLDKVAWTPVTLEEALGISGTSLAANLSNSSDTPWYVQFSEITSARSAVIGDNQSSSFTTYVYGSGTIAFSFKVSSQADHDKLVFYVDRKLMGSWSGDEVWQRPSFTIDGPGIGGTGGHIISWAYAKDESGSAGLDAAFIYGISWTPSSANVSAQVTPEPKLAGAKADAEGQSLSGLAVGTFDGAVFGEQGAVGTVTLTVSSDGEVSGKMLKDGFVRTISKDEVTFALDETAPFRRVVATGSGWTAWQNLWKAEPWKTEAMAFDAAPELTVADGVTLKFSATGTVTAKCGERSCSSVLIPVASPSTLNYQLYLYFPPKSGEFEGYAAEVELVWDGAAFGLAE